MNNSVPGKNERIVREPNTLGGKFIVAGTRIPVALVLAKLAVNVTLEDLFLDYPRLTIEDVNACLEFARDAVEQIENTIRRDAGLAALDSLAALREQLPDLGPIDVVELMRECRDELSRRTEL